MVSVGSSPASMNIGTVQISSVQGPPSALRGRIRSGVEAARWNLTSMPSSLSAIEMETVLRASHSPPSTAKSRGLKAIFREASLTRARAAVSSDFAFEETAIENALPGRGRPAAVRATKVTRTAPWSGSTV